MSIEKQPPRWSGGLLFDTMATVPEPTTRLFASFDDERQLARVVDAGLAVLSERETLNRSLFRTTQQLRDRGEGEGEDAAGAQHRSLRAELTRDVGREARVRVTIKDLRNLLESIALADCLVERRAIADQIAVLERFYRYRMPENHAGGLS